MKIIHGAIRSGKTHRLIEWAKQDTRRGVLVHSMQAVDMLRQAGLESHQIHWFGEPSDRRRGVERMSFAVDNADMILYQICSPHSPVIVTMTEWPEVEHIQLQDEYIEQILKVMTKEQFDKYVIGNFEFGKENGNG